MEQKSDPEWPGPDHDPGEEQQTDASWPPEDIAGMLAAMAADPESSHWSDVSRWIYKRVKVCFPELRDIAGDIAHDVVKHFKSRGALGTFRNQVVQEQDQGGPPPRASFLAFLSTTTRRECLARLEKRAGDTRRLVPLDDPIIADLASLERGGWGDVESFVVDKMMLELVSTYLNRLWRRDAWNRLKVVCFMLSQLHSIPYLEIAQCYGLKPSQVRDAIHSILKQLRDFLAPPDDAPGGSPDPHTKPRKPQRPSYPKRRRQRAPKPDSQKPASPDQPTDEGTKEQNDG